MLIYYGTFFFVRKATGLSVYKNISQLQGTLVKRKKRGPQKATNKKTVDRVIEAFHVRFKMISDT